MSTIDVGVAEADTGEICVSSLLHNWGLGEDGTPNTASLSIHWKEDGLDTPLLILSYNECKKLMDALGTALATQEEVMAEEGMQISKMGRYISIEEDWDDTPSEKDVAHYWAENMRIEKWK